MNIPISVMFGKYSVGRDVHFVGVVVAQHKLVLERRVRRFVARSVHVFHRVEAGNRRQSVANTDDRQTATEIAKSAADIYFDRVGKIGSRFLLFFGGRRRYSRAFLNGRAAAGERNG